MITKTLLFLIKEAVSQNVLSPYGEYWIGFLLLTAGLPYVNTPNRCKSMLSLMDIFTAAPSASFLVNPLRVPWSCKKVYHLIDDFVICPITKQTQHADHELTLNMWTARGWGGFKRVLPFYPHVCTVIVDLLLLGGFFQKFILPPLSPRFTFYNLNYVPAFDLLTDSTWTETVTMAGHTQYLRMWKYILKSSKVKQPSWRINGSKNFFTLPLIRGNTDGVEKQVLVLDTVSGYEYDKKTHMKFL